jgi:hypothetical protein
LGETPGSGVLRLTTAGTDQATFVFYNYAIPSSSGLDISFDFFSYGGQAFGNSNGDGITFSYLMVIPLMRLLHQVLLVVLLVMLRRHLRGPQSGLVNGILGVGFDEFGNLLTITKDVEWLWW